MVFELRLVNLRSWSSNLSKMEYTFNLIQKLQNLEKKKESSCGTERAKGL